MRKERASRKTWVMKPKFWELVESQMVEQGVSFSQLSGNITGGVNTLGKLKNKGEHGYCRNSTVQQYAAEFGVPVEDIAEAHGTYQQPKETPTERGYRIALEKIATGQGGVGSFRILAQMALENPSYYAKCR